MFDTLYTPVFSQYSHAVDNSFFSVNNSTTGGVSNSSTMMSIASSACSLQQIIFNAISPYLSTILILTADSKEILSFLK
jgi:hypothetical protein